MVNVTGDAMGYRMLPDGMVFNEDITIVLPYDSTLLPAGYTPDDIVTYYYDVAYGRWIAIERDSVSEAEALVYSKVNAQPHTLPLAERGSALRQVPRSESVRVLRG